MGTNRQNHLFKFLKEIAIVVIGVLIAVSINKLKENRDNQNYISKTLNAIQKEINHSKTEVEAVLSKHYLIVDSLTKNLENEETISEIISELGGIQHAETTNIGLRFFISNKADLVEYEVISKLSSIESSSSLLDEKLKRMTDFIFLKIDKKDKTSKVNFLLHLTNVIDSEMQLLKLYTEFSEKSKME